MMGFYNDVEFMLASCVLYNALKHRWNNNDAVNKIEIRLKTRCHAISAPMYVVEHTIKGTPVCCVKLRVAKAIVVKLVTNTAANNFELFT